MGRSLKHKKSLKSKVKRKYNKSKKSVRRLSKKLTRKNNKRLVKNNKKQRGGFLDALVPQDLTNLGRHVEYNAKNFYNDLIGQTHVISPSVMSQPINQKNYELIDRDLVDYNTIKNKSNVTTVNQLS